MNDQFKSMMIADLIANRAAACAIKVLDELTLAMEGAVVNLIADPVIEHVEAIASAVRTIDESRERLSRLATNFRMTAEFSVAAAADLRGFVCEEDLLLAASKSRASEPARA